MQSLVPSVYVQIHSSFIRLGQLVHEQKSLYSRQIPVGPREFEPGYFEFPFISNSKQFPLNSPFSNLH